MDLTTMHTKMEGEGRGRDGCGAAGVYRDVWDDFTRGVEEHTMIITGNYVMVEDRDWNKGGEKDEEKEDDKFGLRMNLL